MRIILSKSNIFSILPHFGLAKYKLKPTMRSLVWSVCYSNDFDLRNEFQGWLKLLKRPRFVNSFKSKAWETEAWSTVIQIDELLYKKNVSSDFLIFRRTAPLKRQPEIVGKAARKKKTFHTIIILIFCRRESIKSLSYGKTCFFTLDTRMIGAIFQ